MLSTPPQDCAEAHTRKTLDAALNDILRIITGLPTGSPAKLRMISTIASTESSSGNTQALYASSLADYSPVTEMSCRIPASTSTWHDKTNGNMFQSACQSFMDANNKYLRK
ncbi:unnamed protein product [Clavelina lepadiformis]|uniref:Uncharacterized protein n=1 Tax=Clavelina lepadiformis TaxID=159417 RepID=A0ABP0FP64_CLALP